MLWNRERVIPLPLDVRCEWSWTDASDKILLRRGRRPADAMANAGEADRAMAALDGHEADRRSRRRLLVDKSGELVPESERRDPDARSHEAVS
jgi:hypothetical protein